MVVWLLAVALTAWRCAQAYDVAQFDSCGKSILSTHFFSADGKSWQCADDEPYGHTVHFDDGTSHCYTTLERPNTRESSRHIQVLLPFLTVADADFNDAGVMTHLGLAADRF